ncbi:CLIP domain-containing serine protease 14D-like isoform X1 [Leguminivora glycinivorella]|uniref:CLIP domain-containing serine protease 14D-like isoform X1 n=2 Tax=Leguminivora glycinivorella TaxID=1035111 RepID=UPI00200E925D|nr:CLIP domain-containing serine protease 14D-like isoform X1 [Leguminivora glycinivorella]
MRFKVSFLCVFILYLCDRMTAVVLKNNCSDCIGFKSCTAAMVAIDLQLVALEMSGFCGVDDGRQRKVCCAKVTSGLETALANSIHYHQNVLLLPDNCGIGEEDGYADRVAGGVPVLGLFEYPWMVFISYKTPDGIQFLCAGSLLNDRYVLTAAHCLSGLEVVGVRIRVYDTDCQGDFGCEASSQDILIEEAIIHPGYDRKPVIRNDIGLLRLKNPVDLLFNNAGTVCLPVTRSMRRRNVVDQPATVAHRQQSEKSYESATLLYVNVSIYTAQHCQEQYNRNRQHGAEDDMQNKICSDSSSKGSCRGFSGAPLMVWDRFGDRNRFIQYGIVSYGPNRCGTLYPEVYTDVTKYMAWVLNSIKA